MTKEKAKEKETIVLDAKKGDIFFLMTFMVAMFATLPLMMISVLLVKISHLLLKPSGMLAGNLIEYSRYRVKQNEKRKPRKNK